MAAATAAPWSAVDVESFIEEYYGAWGGTDEDRILSYYTDNIVLQIPGTLMKGKEALRDQFVRPFITAFPGNRHLVKNMIFGPGVVVVEFSFEARHKGRRVLYDQGRGDRYGAGDQPHDHRVARRPPVGDCEPRMGRDVSLHAANGR
jgi:hypothetical protein